MNTRRYKYSLIDPTGEDESMGKSTASNSFPVEVFRQHGESSDRNTHGNSSQERLARPPGPTRSLSRISTTTPAPIRVYKRRFLGLAQLILLNIVISWNWLTFAPVSGTASRYFNVSESVINWLSTAFLFAFIVATPATFYTLAKHGPKSSIVIASCLVLTGNWVRYGGARANSFPAVMLGQLLIGLAQPFTLAAPTTYSNLWFSPAGRTSATAVASLANPLGGALGQLISPMWATDESQIPNAVLYTAIIASVASIPSFFLPAKPPTPPVPSTQLSDSIHLRPKSLRSDLATLFTSLEFYLMFIPFSTLVGTFNAFSSLLNQILEPYGFTEDDAGIAGALLIFVGLLSAAISSPLIDKYKFYLWYIRICTPVISICYLVFIWAPQTRSFAYVGLICAIMGAASFGLVPVVLEFLVETHYPLGPETGSSICWAGGQLLGGIFIIVMDQLKGNGGGAESGDPPGTMFRSLIFQAVFAVAVLPLPLSLGLFGRVDKVRMRRWEIEARGALDEIEEDGEGSEHDRPISGQDPLRF